MPISATFAADFTMFTTAVAVAETKLVSFEDNSKKVAASLSAMEKSISGVSILQAATIAAEGVERLGGVTKLTYAELQRLGSTAQEAVDKMKALGQTVPTNIQTLADHARGASEEMLRLAGATKQTQTATTDWGGALSTAAGYLSAFGIQASVGGVVSFTKSIFDSASAIHDMGERLGISAEAVQGFKFAAEQAGSSMDAVGSAITKMNKGLAEGDKSTVDALKAAGLSFQDIRAMKPEDAFLAITDAIAKMPDPMEQSDVTLKLFGKSAAELLPAIKEGFRGAAEGAQKMSNDTINALERAQDAWEKFGNSVKIVSGNLIAGAIDSGSAVTSSWKNFTQFLLDTIKYGAGMAATMAAVNDKLDQTVAFVGPLQKFAGSMHQTKEEMDAAAAALKKFQEAQAELNSIGQTWQQTLQDINPWILQDIETSLKAGAALKDLATFYGLTESQGRAVTEMIKAQTEAQKEADKALKTQAISLAETTKLWDEYDALRVQHGGTATDAQIAQIDRWYQDVVAKLELAGTYNEQTATAVWSVWQEKLAGVNVNWDDVRKHSKDALQEIADKARATADYVLANSGDFTAAYIRHKEQEAQAAERAAYHWRDTFDEAGQAAARSVATAGDQMIAKFGQIARAAQQATLQMGGSFGVAELTAAQFDQLGGAGRLQQILQSYQANPGRQSGGTGSTGIGATDSAGYLALLQEQRDYAALLEYAKAHHIPGFASGVSNFGGGPAIVGERGPELLYLPTGSSVVPTTRGGVTVHNVFYVNGTAEDVARQIADVMMRTAMQGQQFSGA